MSKQLSSFFPLLAESLFCCVVLFFFLLFLFFLFFLFFSHLLFFLLCVVCVVQGVWVVCVVCVVWQVCGVSGCWVWGHSVLGVCPLFSRFLGFWLLSFFWSVLSSLRFLSGLLFLVSSCVVFGVVLFRLVSSLLAVSWVLFSLVCVSWSGVLLPLSPLVLRSSPVLCVFVLLLLVLRVSSFFLIILYWIFKNLSSRTLIRIFIKIPVNSFGTKQLKLEIIELNRVSHPEA